MQPGRGMHRLQLSPSQPDEHLKSDICLRLWLSVAKEVMVTFSDLHQEIINDFLFYLTWNLNFVHGKILELQFTLMSMKNNENVNLLKDQPDADKN